MSGVHMAKSFPPSLGLPARDVQAMQDVLYDILATGIDPEQAQLPLDAIERFLHEHARANKSPDEFRAFFAQHGLSVSTRASFGPLIITMRGGRLVRARAPPHNTSGTRRATNAAVVIRMGRRRSRFASRMASSRESPLARSLMV